jgi:transcription antitermination factor NusG
LTSKGYDTFLPNYVCAGRSPNGGAFSRLPLFPGYVFCRFDPLLNALIVTTPGVVRIVGYGRNPAVIEEKEIAALKTIVASGVRAEPLSVAHPGDPVRITSGPLRGVEGLLVEMNKRRQFIVSVSILHRSALVELKREWVTAAVGQN